MWQQRSGSRSQRFGPSWRCCSATVMTSAWSELEPVALDEPVARLVASRGRRAACRARSRDRSGRARRPCARAPTTASARSTSGRAASPNSLVGPAEHVLRGHRLEVELRKWGRASPESSTSLMRVGAQPEAQRLERDHLVGRDVAEVDLGAELLDEPGLGGLRRCLEEEVAGVDRVRRSRRRARCASRRSAGRSRRCRPRAPR